jgi:DNA repair protein SbcC/Rad50
MKLRRLHINRLPGIYVPFEVEPDGALFQVVLGPNGIGKSSLCRAVEALYWSDRGPKQQISINAEFDIDGGEWSVIRDGARTRWRHERAESAVPDLPPSHSANCFFLRLRDLIDPARSGTGNVASEIRRQMYGGFDLRKIREDEFGNLRPRAGRSELTAYNQADNSVQREKGVHERLQRREDDLNNLKSQLGQTEAKQRRLHDVNRALGLLDRREELVACLAEFELLPEALAQLTGKEIEQIEELQKKLDAQNRRITLLESEVANANDIILGVRLKEPVQEIELAAWQEYADDLKGIDQALLATRSKHSGCRDSVEEMLSAVGGGDFDEARLELADHGDLFEFLRSAQDLQEKTAAINERLRLLEDIERPEKTQSDLENYRAAANTLRSWLRSAEAGPEQKEKRQRRIWLIVAVVLNVIGVFLAIILHSFFAILAGVGAGIVLPMLVRSREVQFDGRHAAQEVFGRGEVEEPSSWDLVGVEARLRDLDSQASLLDAKIVRDGVRDVERRALENQLNGLSVQIDDLESRRTKLQESLKLYEIRPDADLVDFARSLDQLRCARSKETELAGNVRELEMQHADLLSKLSDVLVSHGEPRPTDTVSAKASLNHVVASSGRLLQANSDLQRATEQRTQAELDLNSFGQSIKEIYSTAGIENGDLHGFALLLSSLEKYMELKSKVHQLESKNDLDLSELDKASEAALADLDSAELDQLCADAAQSSTEAERLRDEIAKINAEVAAAKSGHVIENLIATRGDVLINLYECRSKVIYANAGRFLMDSVEREYEQTQMPRVFDRARELFSLFTKHNFQLQLGVEAGSEELLAKDLANGDLRNLGELSDGTRAQLLLAARIAFAEEVENGWKLPLFLDEALDQSDPVRYEAIVRSLGRIAVEQDRQIFYLTSDPVDIERIGYALVEENCDAPSVIDLGSIRKIAESVSGPSELHVEPRPTTQRPDGLSAEEYGAALGVPLLNPSLGYDNQHFFHLLWDDLDLLHQFLTNSIVRVGQWKAVQGSPLANKLGAHSKSPAEITYRTDLLQNFCELWCQGRGQPVDRDALYASEAITDRFMDGVVALTEELGGDAEKLLLAIRSRNDERLSGFRKNALGKLEQFFFESGYIDNSPMLNEEELRIRILASPAANHLPDSDADECLNRWWVLATRALHHH